MLCYDDLRYFAVPLPEDILRLKMLGDHEALTRVIARRLEADLPLPLRKRLLLEQLVHARMLPYYPYTEDEALRILSDALTDFRPEELQDLRETNAVDALYADGGFRYRDDFLDGLVKTRPAIQKRLKQRELLDAREAQLALTDDVVARMRRSGGLACDIAINASLRVPAAAVAAGETLRVHLPLPVECPQVRDFRLLGATPEPTLIAPGDTAQRTVYFEQPAGNDNAFSVSYAFQSHMDYVDLDPDRVSRDQPGFELNEQLPHIQFTPYLRMLAEDIVGDARNPLVKARRIYDFVTQKPIYSFVRPYFTVENQPMYMATSLKGDCGFFALLFITLCRIAGVPARWQSGLYATPLTIGSHDWAQFYVAPYGWRFVDCSFGASAFRMGATDRQNFYFGNLDPFRVPAAVAYQQEFMPPRRFLRFDPYDNQTGEAETDRRALLPQDYETRCEGRVTLCD